MMLPASDGMVAALPDGNKMCQCGVLKLTMWEGQQNQGYYDRGGFGKERVSSSWGFDDGAGQVSKEAFATAVP